MCYAENPQTGEDGEVSIGFTFSETSGERWYVGESKLYYLVGTDGESQERQNGADGRLPIPAGFKGWVIVPQTSLKLNMATLDDGDKDFSSAREILIDVDTLVAEGKTIYLDEYKFSTESAARAVERLVSLYTGGSGSGSGANGSGGEVNGGGNTNPGGTDYNDDSDTNDNVDTGVTMPITAMAVLAASAAALVFLRKRIMAH